MLFVFLSRQAISQPLGWPKVNKKAVDELVWQAMNQHQIPGAQVVLFNSNKVKYSFSGGVSHIGNLSQVNEKTAFEMASLSKPVFHFLLHTLVEKGKLPPTFFRDTLMAYIDTLKPMKASEVKGVKGLSDFLVFNENYSKEWFKTLTVKQLLTHTAGLGDWTSTSPAYNFYPGQRFDYCDECYILLQRVVEHYLQMPLQQLIDRYLPTSCKGVKQFAWNKNTTNYAFGHFAGMDLMRDIWKTEEGLAHGTLAANALGYARFVQKVAKKNVWALNSDTVHVVENLYWQPGWGIEMSDSGPIYWHWGNDGCYLHVVAFLPGKDFGVVILTNSELGLQMCQTLTNQLFGFKLKGLSWVLGNQN